MPGHFLMTRRQMLGHQGARRDDSEHRHTAVHRGDLGDGPPDSSLRPKVRPEGGEDGRSAIVERGERIAVGQTAGRQDRR
jgi:hypothetical protein